ncbi:class A sortase [Enterococcus rivorum]|uniref:class A sortase n=1 Tax=Enterococcus rivorum TaxID=762845 RepID=UPI000A0231A2|nr:class A sortase [Enterococcus rivorum]MBP2097762.1 sortase A [Enterococcus rivorum]
METKEKKRKPSSKKKSNQNRKSKKKRPTPKKKKSRVKNWLINIFLLLLLLAGLALIFNNQIKNALIHWSGQKYSVANITSETIQKNKESADATFDFSDAESVSTDAVIRAQLSNTVLPVIGGISVPRVGINLPIFKGVGNDVLLSGAGTMKADQEMGKGNYALASHRCYDPSLLFTPMDKMEIGDIIYITDLVNIYTYKTTFKEVVPPEQTELIEDIPGKKLITMVTCGDFNAVTREVIQGELDSVTPLNKATNDMLSAFQMERNDLN